MTEAQQISEQWGGSQPGILAVDSSGVVRVKTIMALIGSTLLAVLSYFHTRYKPALYVREALELQAEITESASYIARTARTQKLISTWDEIIIQEGGIQCDVRALWTLERDTPEARDRLAFNAGICNPVLLVPRPLLLWRQMSLCFTQGPKGAVKRLDVNIGWDGEQHEHAYTRQLVKACLVPYAPRRVYLPRAYDAYASSSTSQALHAAVQAAYAVLCIYLVQEGIVEWDNDAPVRAFLASYLGRFASGYRLPAKVREDVAWDIACGTRTRNIKHLKLPSDVRLPRYTWEEDYRSFSMYVKQVLKDYERRARKASGWKRSYDSDNPSLRAVAAREGIAERTLYDHARRGKLLTQGGDGQPLTIPDGAMAQWKQEREQEHDQRCDRQQLIRQYAAIRNIDYRSAQRWMERQERRGVTPTEIRQKVCQAALRSHGIVADVTVASEDTLPHDEQIAAWEARRAQAALGSDEWCEAQDALEQLRRL